MRFHSAPQVAVGAARDGDDMGKTPPEADTAPGAQAGPDSEPPAQQQLALEPSVGGDSPSAPRNLVHLAPAARRLIAAREARDAHATGGGGVRQALGFTSGDWTRFGLPYKAMKGVSGYKRRNGNIELEVIASQEHGVPYGQDRLIPIWLATAYRLCGRPPNGVIRFRAIRDLIDAFNIPDAEGNYPALGGNDFARLHQRLDRLSRCFFIITQVEAPGNGLQRHSLRRYGIIQAYDFWMPGRGAQHPNHAQCTLWDNTITLDPNWAAELREGDIPCDFNVIRALKNQPMAMDLYLWQAHRSYELLLNHQPRSAVPVFGPTGLLAQIGTNTASEDKVRSSLRRAQRLVKEAWPDCPNAFVDGEKRFLLKPARALHEKARLTLPGWEKDAPPTRLGLEPMLRPASGDRRQYQDPNPR